MFIKGSIIDVEFLNHVNVIGGDVLGIENSGILKTYLFKSLMEAYENYSLVTDKNLHFFDSIRSLHGLTFTSNDCIIIDEFNYAPSELNYLLSIVRDTKCYLVVIGRLFVKQLEYSVDAVYSVSYEEKTNFFKLEHVFKPSCRGTTDLVGIATEDSRSIANVYSDALDSDVVPVYGRSNFFNAYKIFKDTDILLIADKAKFGPELCRLILRLRDKFKDSSGNIYMYLPDCFEEICVKLVNSNIVINEDLYFDAEEMYEKILIYQCGVHWVKNNVKKCLADFSLKYDFTKSSILQDLYNVYVNKKDSRLGKFYAVHFLQKTSRSKNDIGKIFIL